MTFLVTAVTVRIRPLSTIADSYADDATPQPEHDSRGDRLTQAWRDAATPSPPHRPSARTSRGTSKTAC